MGLLVPVLLVLVLVLRNLLMVLRNGLMGATQTNQIWVCHDGNEKPSDLELLSNEW